MFGVLTRSSARAFSQGALKVTDNVAKQQFTISLQQEVAVIDYEHKGNKQLILHETNVPEVFQGKGVGKVLAAYAFDYALKNNKEVTIKCSYLERFYEANKDKYKKLKVKIELDEN